MVIKLKKDMEKHSQQKALHGRLQWIEARVKKIKGFSGYSFEEKKKLIGMMFPYNLHPKKGEFGITVWKTKQGIRFQANRILDNFLIGDISKTNDGYEVNGDYSGKSSFDFS